MTGNKSGKADYLNESFGNNFWNGVCYQSIFSSDFLKKVIHLIPLEVYRSKERKIIMRMLYDYYDQYKMAPNELFYDLFQETEKKLSDKDYDRCMALINILKGFSGKNYQYYLDRLNDSLKHYYLEEGAVEFASLIKAKKYDEAKAVILKAMKATDNQGESDYFDYFTDTSYIQQRLSENKYKMKTLIKGLDNIIGGFNPPWLITILGTPKQGKCAHKDTEVFLPDGTIKTIEEVVKNKNTQVVSLNQKTLKFEKAKITEHFDNGIKPCFEIETRTGRKIKLTGNHPLLTFSGWKQVEKLLVGNAIAVPKTLAFFGDAVMENHKLRLLGYFIADGCLLTNSISITKKENKVVDDFKKCTHAMGDQVSTTKTNTHYVTNHGRTSNTKQWLHSLGLIGKKSADKFIPEEIYKLKKEHISEFLSVLFTCDGSITKTKTGIEISYCTISKQLIYQVQHLLSRFGIVSKVRERQHNKLPEYYFYDLTIKDKENAIKFNEQIGFLFSKEVKIEKYLLALKDKSNNRSFIDNFPYEFISIINEEINSYITSTGKKSRLWWKQKSIVRFNAAKSRKTGINKNAVADIAEIINSPILKAHIQSDLLWDEIINIIPIGYQQTYDITVEKHHNFIGNNIVIHNSFWLLELSVAALFQGLNVLFVSLEMDKKVVEDRLDQIIGFMSSKETEDTMEVMQYKREQWVKAEESVNSIYNIDMVEKNRKRFRRIGGGNLKIVAHHRGRMNYMDVERVLDEAEEKDGFVADVLVVDYLGIMKETATGQSKKERISENCLGLKELCGKRILIGITAMQGNRKAMTAKVFHSHLIADDIDCIHHTDIAMSLCSTKREEAENKYRLYGAINRHGPQNWTLGLIRSLNIGQIAIGEYEVREESNEEEKPENFY